MTTPTVHGHPEQPFGNLHDQVDGDQLYVECSPGETLDDGQVDAYIAHLREQQGLMRAGAGPGGRPTG